MANWYIGPARGAQLATYAQQQWDGLVSQSPALSDQLAASRQIVRQTIFDYVLSWQDEALGPHQGGVPLSETGSGARERYLEAIDVFVQEQFQQLESSQSLDDAWYDQFGLSRAEEEWSSAAQRVLDTFPGIIPALKQAFLNQASSVLESLGLQPALDSLQSNLRSIQRAGALNASVLHQLFGSRR